MWSCFIAAGDASRKAQNSEGRPGAAPLTGMINKAYLLLLIFDSSLRISI